MRPSRIEHRVTMPIPCDLSTCGLELAMQQLGEPPRRLLITKADLPYVQTHLADLIAEMVPDGYAVCDHLGEHDWVLQGDTIEVISEGY